MDDANGGSTTPCLGQVRQVIYRQVTRYLSVPDVIQDVTQDCLVKAWLKIHTLMNVSRASGWVRVLVRNEFVCWLRKRQAHRKATENWATVLDQAPQDPAEAVVNRISVERLLANLNALDRDILELRFLYGLPSAEIGRHMGLAPSSARCRIMRSKAELAHSRTTPQIRLDVLEFAGPALD